MECGKEMWNLRDFQKGANRINSFLFIFHTECFSLEVSQQIEDNDNHP